MTIAFVRFNYRRALGLLAGGMALLTASCVSETPNYMKRHKVHEESERKFPELKDYHVQLENVSRRRLFKPGEEAILTYKFTNVGSKPLRIDEWFMNDPDNVKLYYRKWEEGLRKFIIDEWTCIEPEMKKPVRHFELVLNPGNSVLIRKHVSFIEKLPPGEKPPVDKYYVRAALNLNSIKAWSKASIINIKP